MTHQIFASIYGGKCPVHFLLSSPHKGGMPVLFTDSSTRTLAYSKKTNINIANGSNNPDPEAVMHMRLWNYNDGGEVPAGFLE